MSLTQQENAPADFRGLNISAPLLRAVEASGYETPTPIQAKTIPHLMNGKDLIGHAQTGTGKTCLLYTSPSPRDS